MIKKILLTLMILFALCINAFAIEKWEAEPYIGKEVDVGIFMRTKNQEFKFNLTARLVDIITFLGYDYVALEGRYNPPILIPCQNVDTIKRKR